MFAVAISAAIIGDNLGYLVGRRAGNWLLTRPGRWEEQRLRFLDEGEHFFSRHGGKTVFFGRWLPVLRFTAALLAGVNEMPWRRFFVFNAAGRLGLGADRRVGRLPARVAAHRACSRRSASPACSRWCSRSPAISPGAARSAGREPRAPRRRPAANESGE